MKICRLINPFMQADNAQHVDYCSVFVLHIAIATETPRFVSPREYAFPHRILLAIVEMPGRCLLLSTMRCMMHRWPYPVRTRTPEPERIFGRGTGRRLHRRLQSYESPGLVRLVGSMIDEPRALRYAQGLHSNNSFGRRHRHRRNRSAESPTHRMAREFVVESRVSSP